MGACDENLSDLPSFYLEMGNSYNTLDHGQELSLDKSGLNYFVFSKPIVPSWSVLNVELVRVQNGKLAMRFYFDDEGQRELYRTSVTNKGRMIITVVDGKAIGARQIDGPMEGGVFYTFTELSDDELMKLVASMQESLLEMNRLKKSNGI
ncbi:MAG: hypothetical protein ACQKBW_00440 [Puniceicoccales bacterium]